MINIIKQNIKAVVLGLVVTVGIGYAAAQTFTDPTCAPPNCNTDAPINVGYGAQVKDGGLWISGMTDAVTVGTYSLVTENAPIKADGGFIIETRASDPSSPETGRMWLIE